MRKLILMAGLVAAVFACSTAGDMVADMLDSGVPDAGAETPGDGSSMQYVGNSTETFRGWMGLYFDIDAQERLGRASSRSTRRARKPLDPGIARARRTKSCTPRRFHS